MVGFVRVVECVYGVVDWICIDIDQNVWIHILKIAGCVLLYLDRKMKSVHELDL